MHFVIIFFSEKRVHVDQKNVASNKKKPNTAVELKEVQVGLVGFYSDLTPAFRKTSETFYYPLKEEKTLHQTKSAKMHYK